MPELKPLFSLDVFPYIAGVFSTDHEVQSRHRLKKSYFKVFSFCTYFPIFWLPVCQGFFQLLESHGPAFPGVGEEQWSRFPRNLETGTQLKQIRIGLNLSSNRDVV